MKIRKTQQPADYPDNQIHDAYNTSTSDTYTCNYINGKVIEESGTDYIKYGDGTMECWGRKTFGSITGQTGIYVSVSLPEAYKDTTYNIQLTKAGGGDGFTLIVESVMNITVNSFDIYGWNNRTATSTVNSYEWRTIGKWK